MISPVAILADLMKTIVIVLLLLIGGTLGLPGMARGELEVDEGIFTAPTLKILDTCSGGGSLFTCPEGSIQKGLLGNVTDGLFVVLTVMAALTIVFAGYIFLTAGGDPEKVKKAREFVLYALIGVAVAFSARALVGLVHWMVGA